MPSSVIYSISYNAPTATLRIIFMSGAVYDYKGVPIQIYDEMKIAVSKGSFFNEMIKDKFAFEKVSE